MKEKKSEIFQIRRPAKMSNFYKLFATGLGIALMAFLIFGCSTETPWEPAATQLLTVNIITGPDSTTAVPHASHATFTWSARGGSGVMSGYQFYLEGVETTWRSLTDTTAATYTNLVGPATLTFHIRAVDSQNNTAADSRWFAVLDTAAAVPNTDRPVVSFASFPEESSSVAVGKSVTFTWEVSDDYPANGVILCRHILNPGGTWSDWSEATSANYANLTARDPAIFIVQAKDEDDSTSTDSTSVFIIQPANILWVDDYAYSDPYGARDNAAERSEVAFYHALLGGYAFADWDIDTEGRPPYTADLVSGGTPIYSTVVWNAEDGDGNYWLYDDSTTGNPGGVLTSPLRSYLQAGGNLLVTGGGCLQVMYENYPPGPNDFEYLYLGVDTLTAWDTDDFTWAIKDAGATGYPDSSKIDVGKDGTQLRVAEVLLDSAGTGMTGLTVIFRNGLDVDGNPTGYYHYPVANLFQGSGFKTARIGFDTYYMPEADMHQTFVSILTWFGE